MDGYATYDFVPLVDTIFRAIKALEKRWNTRNERDHSKAKYVGTINGGGRSRYPLSPEALPLLGSKVQVNRWSVTPVAGLDTTLVIASWGGRPTKYAMRRDTCLNLQILQIPQGRC